MERLPYTGMTLRRLLMLGSAAAQERDYSVIGNPVAFRTNLAKPLSSLLIPFTPIQSLNGQDAPYPPGGGKNKFPITLTTQTKNDTTFTVSDDGSITISGTPSELTRVSLNNAVFTPTTNMFFSMTGSATGVRVFCKKTTDGTVTYPTLSPTASVSTGITMEQFLLEVGTGFAGTVTVKMQLEEGSAASPWTPYSNICPISGWTGCDISRTGINLWNPSNIMNAYIEYASPNTIRQADGYRLAYIPVKEGVTYTISKASGARNRVSFTNALPEANMETFGAVMTDTSPKTVTAPVGAKYMCVYCVNSGEDADTVLSSFMIELGESATPYTPFTGQSYPVTFPDGQTVYGGTLDAVNGVLTVDMESVDMGTLTWTEGTDATGKYFKTNIPGIKGVSGSAVVGNLICSAYKTVASNAVADLCIAVGTVGGGSIVYCRDLAYSNAQDFTSAVNGQTIVYELATPIEIPLSSLSVPVTLVGDNVIWSDTNGQNTVTYKKKG